MRLVGIFIFTFCFSLSALADQDDFKVEYPEVWGELAQLKFANSECPNLHGEYLFEGDGYAEWAGVPTSASMNGTLKSKVNDVLYFSMRPTGVYLSEKIMFMLEQAKPDELKIVFSSKNLTNQIETYLLNIKNKDFECHNGWLMLREVTGSAGGEQSHTNFRDLIWLSKLTDGSLIVYRHELGKHTSIWYLGLGEYEDVSKLYVRYKLNTHLNN